MTQDERILLDNNPIAGNYLRRSKQSDGNFAFMPHFDGSFVDLLRDDNYTPRRYMNSLGEDLTVTQNRDLRLYLQQEFSRRREKNSSYSFRAFANFLRTDISTSPKILSRRSPASANDLVWVWVNGDLEQIEGADCERFIPEGEVKQLAMSFVIKNPTLRLGSQSYGLLYKYDMDKAKEVLSEGEVCVFFEKFGYITPPENNESRSTGSKLAEVDGKTAILKSLSKENLNEEDSDQLKIAGYEMYTKLTCTISIGMRRE